MRFIGVPCGTVAPKYEFLEQFNGPAVSVGDLSFAIEDLSLAQLCPLAAMCRYYCVECLTTYVGDNIEASLGDSIQGEMDKRRRCNVCEPPQKRSSAAARKRKEGTQRDDGDDDSEATAVARNRHKGEGGRPRRFSSPICATEQAAASGPLWRLLGE